VVIILEHSFFIWDLKHSNSTQPLKTAITTYQKSPHSQVVQEAVKNSFKDISQGNLENTLVQIALNNLLCKSLLSILDLFSHSNCSFAAKDNITIA
jgi:hypothetical protein